MLINIFRRSCRSGPPFTRGNSPKLIWHIVTCGCMKSSALNPPGRRLVLVLVNLISGVGVGPLNSSLNLNYPSSSACQSICLHLFHSRISSCTTRSATQYPKTFAFVLLFGKSPGHSPNDMRRARINDEALYRTAI
ncbi:hypothetical protein SISSUDRAFT_73479 [Sistotremastrum suecicum HHB10207 ss-3]|uniref:Uncharacterized protein n=1 Tax=Sistotremastrum suecicum HHB10207 ss-3 TaxID=1314776 RepID=A0A166BGK0_9AGAM|nr:hypothetical protein SISSUDRAFT_73479 [Sistotremastrum suecicum HHB10207 ss-3]